MADYDLYELACLCHAALAQDSPEPPQIYLNKILNLSWGYLTSAQKDDIERYLAEKEYLPEVKIEISK